MPPTETTGLFTPRARAEDEAVTRFGDMRRTGLQRFGELLSGRLAGDDAHIWAVNLRLSERLGDADWIALAVNPFYNYWWAQLSLALSRGDGDRISELTPELSRLMFIRLAQSGLLDAIELTLPPVTGGVLRLPGHPREVDCPGFTRQRRLNVHMTSAGVAVTDGDHCVEIPLASLLGEGVPPDGRLRDRPEVPDTSIEVDATDPWLVDFLDEENNARPSPGRRRDDITPAAVSGQALQQLADSLGTIGSAWPAMHREIHDYVQLVVPFSSEVRGAFTNVHWHGAIFLRNDFGETAANVERLVHETSHLRLNLLMTLMRLHDHSLDDLVPSPFRAGLRPVAGLYHGAFVVARAAMALDRCCRARFAPAMAARIPILVAQVELALRTLRSEVRLTAAGAELLDEIDPHVAALADRYGVADPNEPKVYEEA